MTIAELIELLTPYQGSELKVYLFDKDALPSRMHSYHNVVDELLEGAKRLDMDSIQIRHSSEFGETIICVEEE